MPRKAKKLKNGNHPTILSRWKAQESYRTSLAKHNIGEKEIMLHDRIALNNHDYTATKADEYKICMKNACMNDVHMTSPHDNQDHLHDTTTEGLALWWLITLDESSPQWVAARTPTGAVTTEDQRPTGRSHAQ